MLDVLVVEDEGWLREDLARLLARAGSETRLAAACPDGKSAIRFAATGRFDVALVDLGLPDRPGAEVIAELRRLRPAAVLLAFTIFDDAPSVFAALRAGARGYLLKTMPIDRLVAAIHEAHAGGAPMTPTIARFVVDALVEKPAAPTEPALPALTPREAEVLAFLARGITYAEVASALGIGLGTVQSHVKRIYEKLEISSKAEAAALAVKLGIA